MCGIAGILRVHPPGTPVPPHEVAIPEAWLDVLDASIKHRGPDGQGRFRDRAVRADGTVVDVALVHRRLSILDHAGGAQPMVSLRRAERARSASEEVAGDSRLATGDSKGVDGATFQGLALPVQFHGKPNDAVRYGEVGGGERHSLALRAPKEAEGYSLAHRAPKEGSDLVAVVFNGCIYNHRELRKELQVAGHTFVSDHSDTEVLVHGWREWGIGRSIENDHLPLRSESLFSRLHDMFAVGVWNRSDAQLVLARDRFGQKPLYYLDERSRDILAFSSSTRGLRQLQSAIGGLPKIEPTELHQWIRFGHALHPPIANIHALPISTTLNVSGREHAIEWYEIPEFWGDFFVGMWGEVGMSRSKELIPSELDAMLQAAVLARLDADVPIGCFLSGGVDSSLLAHYAKRATDAVRTFCVRMPDAAYDESSHAETAAGLIGTHHTTLDCLANPCLDLVELIQQLDMPFGDSSLLPTHWVSKATREYATVSIAGDGGDELFAGYDRYRASGLLAKVWPLLALLPITGDGSPKSKRSRLARLADAARHDEYRDLVSIFPESFLNSLIPERGASDTRERGHWLRSAFSGTEMALEYDLAHYLPNDLLRKTDTASMSVALEVRCPFLAPSVAGPSSHATVQSLMPRGQRKGLLRQLARKYLPAEIVDRPKMGFAIPIGEWFRTDYGGMRTLLMDTLNSADPFPASKLGLELNRTFIAKMVDEHMNGKRDHSQRLYMLLVLGIWIRTV